MQNCNKVIISCAAAVFALYGCTQDLMVKLTGGETGRVNLSITADKNITQAVSRSLGGLEMSSLESLSVDDLAIVLQSTEGESYGRRWDSATEFPEDAEFPVGKYMLTAYYGDNEAEGFDQPHLMGTTDFSVLAERSTSVNLTAQITNSLVYLETTSNFRNYFEDYALSITSAAGNQFAIADTETRPVYVNPGTVDITADVTLPSGTKSNISLGRFTAKATTLQRITLTVENSDDNTPGDNTGNGDGDDKKDPNTGDNNGGGDEDDKKDPNTGDNNGGGDEDDKKNPNTGDNNGGGDEGDKKDPNTGDNNGGGDEGDKKDPNTGSGDGDDKKDPEPPVDKNGSVRLVITFDDGMTTETTRIDLSEDLFNAAPPVVTPEGFDAENNAFSYVEGAFDGDCAVNIAAQAGLSRATLTIGETPYNLLDATDFAELSDLGIKFINVNSGSKLAKINLKGYLAGMTSTDMFNSRSTSMKLEIADALSRAEEIDLSAEVSPKEVLKIEPILERGSRIVNGKTDDSYLLLNKEYEIRVFSNLTGDPTDPGISLTIANPSSNDLTPKISEDKPGEFIYTLSAPEDFSDFEVAAIADRKELQVKTDNIHVPRFTLKEIDPADVWATHTHFVVEPVEEADRDIIKDNINFDGLGAAEIATRKDDELTFDVTKLSDNKEYTLIAYLGNDNFQTHSVGFTTEEKKQLPNSGFDNEAWPTPIKKGDYQYLWTIDEWNTVNELTTSTNGSGSGNGTNTGGCAYKATSGTIPANSRSNYSNSYGGLIGTKINADGHTVGNKLLLSNKMNGGSNAALIRTVGYGSGNAAGWTTTNPASGFQTCQKVASGELIYGIKNDKKYSGKEFTSRPTSISFYYMYNPYGTVGDYGEFEAVVVDDDDNPITEVINEKLDGQGHYDQKSYDFTYIVNNKKAAKIMVRFKSSAHPGLTNNSEWLYGPGNKNVSGGEYVGSELYIDDIELHY